MPATTKSRKAPAPKGKVGAPKAAKASAPKLDGGRHGVAVAAKGYDPAIPLENRSAAEKQATVLGHASASKPGAKPKAAAKKGSAGPRKPSMRTEAEEVLRAKGSPLHVKDITAAVLGRGKIETKGKTPEASLSSIMLRHPAFEKTAPGTFSLVAPAS